MKRHHLLIFVILCFAPALTADTLPDPTFGVFADDYQGNICTLDGPGTCNLGGTNAGIDSGRLLTLTSHAQVFDNSFRYAYSNVQYAFTAYGGKPQDSVKVDILFDMHVSESAEPVTQAYALASITGLGTTVAADYPQNNFSQVEVCQRKVDDLRRLAGK
jgi:hypothetical protein